MSFFPHRTNFFLLYLLEFMPEELFLPQMENNETELLTHCVQSN